MRFLFLLLFSLTTFISFGQSEDKITVPKGVVYKYCDPKTVEKAKELIRADIRNKNEYALSGKPLIIGPVLWARFKQIDEVANIPGGNTTFHVDGNQLSGKMTQDVDDTKKVWSAFRKEISGQDFTIRKLNEKELQYYWSVISFDIDEPLLIVETAEHKYILNILKDSMKLMWLDEAPQ